MKILSAAIAIAALLAGAACSHVPSLGKQQSAPAAPEVISSVSESPTPPLVEAVTITPAERLSLAIDLLGAGQEAEARLELKSILDQSPRHAAAQNLMRQIEGDPIALLGAPVETYVVQTGDTMSELAGRFLGDPLKFYVLSRYNSLPAPNALPVGRSLKLPAASRKAIEMSNESPIAADASATILAGEASGDVVKAAAARLEGLQLLNTGEIARAITRLNEAQALNPSDTAIRRDLERAKRIEAALGDR